MRWRMFRPRTHARMLRFMNVSSPVLSGSTRATTPSLTFRRNGQRDPQLTMQADQNVASASGSPSAAAAGPLPGIPRLVVEATSVEVPAAIPDHLGTNALWVRFESTRRNLDYSAFFPLARWC